MLQAATRAGISLRDTVVWGDLIVARDVEGRLLQWYNRRWCRLVVEPSLSTKSKRVNAVRPNRKKYAGDPRFIPRITEVKAPRDES